MALLFRIGQEGSEALTRIFSVKIPKVLRSLKPELEEVGDIVREKFHDVFKAEGAVGGEPKWEPLSEKWTVPEREEGGFVGANPILVRTGDYKFSFRKLKVSDLRLAVGSDEVRDTLLQLGGLTGLGTYVPPRTVTARVQKAYQADDARQIVDVIRDGLIRRMRAEGVPVVAAA